MTTNFSLTIFQSSLPTRNYCLSSFRWKGNKYIRNERYYNSSCASNITKKRPITLRKQILFFRNHLHKQAGIKGLATKAGLSVHWVQVITTTTHQSRVTWALTKYIGLLRIKESGGLISHLARNKVKISQPTSKLSFGPM